MKVAIVGATGLVGAVLLKVLEERNFPISDLLLVASPRSVGKNIRFKNKEYTVIGIEEAIAEKPNIAIFSAGGSTSGTYAPRFAEIGCKVIDNSSYWRMHDDIPLVVPEVNGAVLTKEHRIIANPNCSTMQLMPPLKAIHSAYGINRLVISTYQSFTGTGSNAVRQYEAEKNDQVLPDEERAYAHPIFANCIPLCGSMESNDYTTEENKLVNETRKILNATDIAITATTVRVPVFGGHSIAVNVETKTFFELENILHLLGEIEGVVIQDNAEKHIYPTPLEAYDKDEIFIGRIRRDHSIENGLNMWVVSDNLRKGAATNTVQIAEYLMKHELL